MPVLRRGDRPVTAGVWFLAGFGACIFAEVLFLAWLARKCLPKSGWTFK